MASPPKPRIIIALLATAVALGLVATIFVTFTAPLSTAKAADTTLPPIASPTTSPSPSPTASPHVLTTPTAGAYRVRVCPVDAVGNVGAGVLATVTMP